MVFAVVGTYAAVADPSVDPFAGYPPLPLPYLPRVQVPSASAHQAGSPHRHLLPLSGTI